jgi:hypothetical protein
MNVIVNDLLRRLNIYIKGVSCSFITILKIEEEPFTLDLKVPNRFKNLHDRDFEII